MPILLPQVDYSPLYRAIQLKTGAKSTLIGTESLDIMGRIRNLEERQRSVQRRGLVAETALGVAELLLQFGQSVYGIFEQQNFETAKADLHDLQQQMTGKVRTYIDNNQFTWATDDKGSRIMQMPAEFETWYQESLSAIEEQYEAFPRVQSWAKDQLYQMYNQSTQAALTYGRNYAIEQTQKQFERNVNNAMADAVNIGDFAPVEAVINSARNWLGDPQADNLLEGSRAKYKSLLFKKQVHDTTQTGLDILRTTDSPEYAEQWIEKNTPFLDDMPEQRTEIVDEIWRQWGVSQEREKQRRKQSGDKTELDYMDRLQKGNLPTWVEIRDSDLSRERKEHWRNLINDLAEEKREAEKQRQKDLEDMREKARKEEISEAYLRAYSEIIDWPMGQEEQVEERILGDPDLTNEDKEHLIDEYRSRDTKMHKAAEKEGPLEVTDDNVLAEVIRMFYDTSAYSNDQVRDFIKSKHGKGLSNADATRWLDKVSRRTTYVTEKVALDMIDSYFDDICRDELDQSKVLEARLKQSNIFKTFDEVVTTGILPGTNRKLTEKGLLEFAQGLLLGDRAERTGGLFRKWSAKKEYEKLPEPETVPLTAEDPDLERYRRFKGADPVARGEIGGTPAFFDGTYWYMYQRPGEWYRWEGERWVIAR
jgi:hypothetical protein